MDEGAIRQHERPDEEQIPDDVGAFARDEDYEPDGRMATWIHEPTAQDRETSPWAVSVLADVVSGRLRAWTMVMRWSPEEQEYLGLRTVASTDSHTSEDPIGEMIGVATDTLEIVSEEGDVDLLETANPHEWDDGRGESA